MPESRKHIVIVTTWFPPLKGVAVNRMSAFVKYLNASTFKISVITLQENDAAIAKTLNGATIYRLNNNSVLSVFKEEPGEPKFLHYLKVAWNVLLSKLKPLEFLKWKGLAVKELIRLHSSEPIDLIISSYSPAETHLAAIEFCKKFPSVKWIADMRDEMSKNPHANGRQKTFLKNIESSINKHASAVTSVSEPILADFRILMPSIKHFEEIRNGFDHSLPPQNNFNDLFTISYAGTFYGARKPTTFFQGLHNFIIKTNATIKLQFIGTNKNFEVPGDCKKYYEFTPFVTNQKAIEMIAASDANLLVLPHVDGKGVYTGKIFDYISVMKPIIAVVDPTDVAAKLILEHNAGFVADFDNIGQIETAITSAYNLWKEKKSLNMDMKKIAMLHRKYQAAKLETLIDKLLAE